MKNGMMMTLISTGGKTPNPVPRPYRTDPGGPVGRTGTTSRVDPQSRPVDLVDLDPVSGQQEPVDPRYIEPDRPFVDPDLNLCSFSIFVFIF